VSKCCNKCLDRGAYVAPFVPDIEELVSINSPEHPWHGKEALVIRFDIKGMLLELSETNEQQVFPIGSLLPLSS
jgi:hypothetical protein